MICPPAGRLLGALLESPPYGRCTVEEYHAGELIETFHCRFRRSPGQWHIICVSTGEERELRDGRLTITTSSGVAEAPARESMWTPPLWLVAPFSAPIWGRALDDHFPGFELSPGNSCVIPLIEIESGERGGEIVIDPSQGVIRELHIGRRELRLVNFEQIAEPDLGLTSR